jgi:4'-phosphopantetheinyl transferase
MSTLRQDEWNIPPDHITLGRDDIHVWRAPLSQATSMVEALLNTLTPDERHRAERYYRQQDRERFIVARGVLRTILAGYLNLSSVQVSFTYSSYGKPDLTETINSGGLRFNVSHSNELVLYVITREREVGIDVEFIREDFASLEIAEHFFSEKEIATLRTLPASVHTTAFFNCWTRKEAYIKALGEGLSHPLHQFEVSLRPGEPAALLRTGDDPQEASCWDIYELFPGPGYVAALAVERAPLQLSCWQWSNSNFPFTNHS